jgi:hypothetical protein
MCNVCMIDRAQALMRLERAHTVLYILPTDGMTTVPNIGTDVYKDCSVMITGIELLSCSRHLCLSACLPA